MKEGTPPPEFVPYGQAPMYISDSMPPYRHPATGVTVDSRSALRAMDKATGSITTDKHQAPNRNHGKELERRRREDLRKCLLESVAKIDSGNSGLSEETRAMCERQNEVTSAALGIDAFNVAGRKANAKGKRYRKRRS